MEQPRTPERLRELIDEALEEIERTELEMLDLMSDVLGPQHAKRLAEQITAQERAERFERLRVQRELSHERLPTTPDERGKKHHNYRGVSSEER